LSIKRNPKPLEVEADAKGDSGKLPSEYLCQRDIEMLAWHLSDGHSLSLIASWLKVHKGTAKRRMERAIRTLVAAGVPVAGVRRERINVLPVSRLRMRDGAGLDDL
jgi:hypothetical protein